MKVVKRDKLPITRDTRVSDVISNTMTMTGTATWCMKKLFREQILRVLITGRIFLLFSLIVV